MHKANRIRMFKRPKFILVLLLTVVINGLDVFSKTIYEPYLYGTALQSAWTENMIYQGTSSFGTVIFSILAFLVPSFLLADCLVEDRKSGLDNIFSSKVGKTTYIQHVFIDNFIYSGLFIMAIPFINILMWLLIRPAFSLNYISANLINEVLFAETLMISPVLFLFLHLLKVFFVGGIIGSLTLMVNDIGDNAYLGLASIFVFDLFMQILSQFISSWTGFNINFSQLNVLLSGLFVSNRIGTFIYLAVLFLLPIIYFSYKEKRNL